MAIVVGGHDAWGVRQPNGKVREFSTLAKAQAYANAMEGQAVTDVNGRQTVWTGLTVVHRFIPNWEEVPS